MLGHHLHASETAGGPIMARLWWYLDPSSPHQLEKNEKKNVIKVGPPLTKLSGSTVC